MKKRRRSPKPELESKLEHEFYHYWIRHYPVRPITQYHFHNVRRWRFDFCWPDKKIAVEIQGFGEGHNSYNGMHSDYEKHNTATLLGWRIIYLMGVDIQKKTIKRSCDLIQQLLEGKTGTNEVPTRSSNWSDKVEARRRRLLKGTD